MHPFFSVVQQNKAINRLGLSGITFVPNGIPAAQKKGREETMNLQIAILNRLYGKKKKKKKGENTEM